MTERQHLVVGVPLTNGSEKTPEIRKRSLESFLGGETPQESSWYKSGRFHSSSMGQLTHYVAMHGVSELSPLGSSSSTELLLT